jgi:nitrate reductase cytochrome c-type subunit
MSKQSSAIALMAILSVCVMPALVAAANPQTAKEAAEPKRTQEDVNEIVAQQKASLTRNRKLRNNPELSLKELKGYAITPDTLNE